VRLFADNFEGSGYVETWSAGETVGGSSTLDEDAATTLVSSPPGWGSQCLQCQLVSPDTQAYVENAFGAEEAETYTRIEFILTAEDLADGESVTLFETFRTGGAQGLYAIKLRQTAGDLEIVLDVNHDATSNLYMYAGVELNKRYKVEVKWDSTFNTWNWLIDGEIHEGGSLTGGAEAWGLDIIRLGINEATGQGTTVYFNNINIVNDGHAGPADESYLTSGTLFWAEQYETPGDVDESWSTGSVVSFGNTANAGKSTSGVSGAPGSWGDECLEVTLGAGAIGGDAMYRHVFPFPKDIVYLRQEFIVDAEALATGEAINILTWKESQSPEVINGRILIRELAIWTLVQIELGGGEYIELARQGTLTEDTRYVVEVKYDSTNGYWAVWLDGKLTQSGHIRDHWGQSTSVIVSGSEGSSGRDITVYLDNTLASESGFPIVP
jgi:hypothetical protein